MTHPAARVSARLGEVEWRTGQLDQALERMERAFEVLAGDEPDDDLATLAAELGRLHFFKGEIDLAAERIDTAIEIAESLWLPEVLSQALNTQGLIAGFNGRSEQSLALLKHALELALEHDLDRSGVARLQQPRRPARSPGPLRGGDRAAAAGARPRPQGRRPLRSGGCSASCAYCFLAGQWTEALDARDGGPRGTAPVCDLRRQHAGRDRRRARRCSEARAVLVSLGGLKDSADVQDRAIYASCALRPHAEGSHEEALAVERGGTASAELLGGGVSEPMPRSRSARGSSRPRARAARNGRGAARADRCDPAREAAALAAGAGRAVPSAAGGGARRGRRSRAGVQDRRAVFREHRLTFPLAVTQLEHGEWLTGRAGPTKPSRCSPRPARSSSGSRRRRGSSGRTPSAVEAVAA